MKEFTFYQYYARLVDYCSVSEEETNDLESMISISVILGFNTKKELPKIEQLLQIFFSIY